MFISSFFYLVLLSFSLASIQLFHPAHGLFCFILCYLSWVYTFSIMFIPHCKYFFLSSCTRNMAHNAVNTRSQSLLHRRYTCTRPVRQMPFGVTTLKIEVLQPNIARPHYVLEGNRLNSAALKRTSAQLLHTKLPAVITVTINDGRKYKYHVFATHLIKTPHYKHCE